MKRLLCLLTALAVSAPIVGCSESPAPTGGPGSAAQAPELKETKEKVNKTRPKSEAY